jgi:low temperature requirement protein LtrA
VLLRTALAALWLRAARSDTGRRRTALRFATGVTVCQAGWIGLIFVPVSARLTGIMVMVVAELSVPVWAQAAGMTPWHPHHIAERYELFTLIVLGESVAAATAAVRSAFDRHHDAGALYALATGGLLMVFAMWWLYFARPAHTLLATTHQAHQAHRKRFTWAYGHYLIFAAAAAEEAGLAMDADHITGRTQVSPLVAGGAVTIPAAIFLSSVWAVHVRPHQVPRVEQLPFPAAVILVLTATLSPAPALGAGLVLAALVIVVTVADPIRRVRERQ